MSKVTDEQLQAIAAEYAGLRFEWPSNESRRDIPPERILYCDGTVPIHAEWHVTLFLQALRERDTRIIALEAKCALHAASEAQALRQQDRLQLLVESMEECICIDDGQDFEDRAEELLVIEVREEYHLVEIDNLKAQLAELRKPVTARIAQLEKHNRDTEARIHQYGVEIGQLIAENQRLRADTERLNLLDQWALTGDFQYPQFSWDRDKGIRSAIDAARSGK